MDIDQAMAELRKDNRRAEQERRRAKRVLIPLILFLVLILLAMAATGMLFQ